MSPLFTNYEHYESIAGADASVEALPHANKFTLVQRLGNDRMIVDKRIPKVRSP